MGKYTAIDDPSAHFQVETYTGAGQNTSVTFSGNSDLKPDLLWIKNRSAGYAHALFDSNRSLGSAVNAPFMEPNDVSADNSNQNWWNSTNNGINTDGFQFGSVSEHNLNNLNSEYVAWAWKMDAGSTSTLSTANAAGTSTNSTVQVNSTAKQSIFTYTGTATSFARVAHGLGEKADMYIIKPRGTTGGAALNWVVYHKDSASNPERSYAFFTTAAFADNTTYWAAEDNGSAGAITFGGAQQVFYNGTDYVGYAFKGVQGYSKFGKYTGNGQGSGPFIYLGFTPSLLIIKRTDGDNDWVMHSFDQGTNSSTGVGKGNDWNENDNCVRVNSSGHQDQYGRVDLLSNGFKVRSAGGASENASTGNYIYAAWAYNPFVTSTGIPATAR